jgi:hypothetical protein
MAAVDSVREFWRGRIATAMEACHGILRGEDL